MFLLEKLRYLRRWIIYAIIEFPPLIFFIIFLIVWMKAVIETIICNYKIPRLGASLMKKPSNKKVKKYIDFLKRRWFRTNSRGRWNSLRQTYNMVSKNEEIDIELVNQWCELLHKKGTSGIYYSKRLSKEEQDKKIRKAGEKGEEDAAYALEWLDRSRFKIFSDVRLPYNGKSQQFDNIIVGDKAVFNLETKNFIGNLVIDEEGNWYRTIGDKKTGTENVNFQVRRHNKVLNSILEDKLPIVDLIVWTNVESIIEGAQYSSTKIIKVDQLVEFVEGYNDGVGLSQEEIDFAIKTIEKNMIHTSKVGYN